eukprot:m.85735 g.85735  ORF g.85735 m.85735 type:complete len:209 (+) comp14734_c0_seq2:113-739(+)
MSKSSLASNSAFHPDEDLKPCQNCEEDMALLHCVDCDALYCRSCSDVLHKSPKMRVHLVKRISEVQPSAADGDDYDNIANADLPSFNDTSVQELMDRDLSSIGLNPAEMMEWQCAEVNCWLRHLGNPFASYADTFEAEQIRGRLIPHLDEGSLLRLGVSHRDVPRLMEAIRRLQLTHQLCVVQALLVTPPDVSVPTAESGKCALPVAC